MNLLKLTSIYFLVILSNHLLAREIDSTLIKKSIIKLELSSGGIGYEYLLNTKNSINFEIQYSDLLKPSKHDFIITSDFRLNMVKNQEALLGFYIAGFVYYKDFDISKDIKTNNGIVYSRDNIKVIGTGFKVGIQSKLGKRLVLETYFGIGYNLYRNINNLEGNKMFNNKNYNSIAVFGLTLGYKF